MTPFTKTQSIRQIQQAVGAFRLVIGERDSIAKALLQQLSGLSSVRDTNDVMLEADSTARTAAVYLTSPGTTGRFTELRLRYATIDTVKDPITLTLTSRRCDLDCNRDVEVLLRWERSPRQWRPTDLVVYNGVEITHMRFDQAAPRSEPRSVVGVVRDDRGEPLADAEVYSLLGTGVVRTSANGSFRLALDDGTSELIGVRKLGSTPVYLSVTREQHGEIPWNPKVGSAQVLATRLIRASAAPKGLESRRFDDFLTRYQRGRGRFLVTDEIWHSVGMGDVLNRIAGLSADMSHGYNISRIRAVRCQGGLDRIGVFIDGVDMTRGMSSASFAGNSPEQVLSDISPAAIAALEYYRRSEMPAEYIGGGYCAVIGLWTR
jgi:hypothetical protein